jgi:hypothetical protein
LENDGFGIFRVISESKATTRIKLENLYNMLILLNFFIRLNLSCINRSPVDTKSISPILALELLYTLEHLLLIELEQRGWDQWSPANLQKLLIRTFPLDGTDGGKSNS